MKIFDNIFRWLAKDIITSEINIALYENQIQRHSERNSVSYFMLQEFVGKKLMIIGNEWQDVIYAEGIGVELVSKGSSPTLKVRDVLTNDEYVTCGKVFEYSPELYTAMYKLTPYERWNLAAPHSPVPWDKKRISVLKDPLDLEQQLRSVGFFN